MTDDTTATLRRLDGVERNASDQAKSITAILEEVRRLEAAGLRRGRTASRAIGYRQVLEHLAGEIDEAAAKQSTITRTRRFARKQLGWFRRDDRIIWVDATRPVEDLVDELLAGPLRPYGLFRVE